MNRVRTFSPGRHICGAFWIFVIVIGVIFWMVQIYRGLAQTETTCTVTETRRKVADYSTSLASYLKHEYTNTVRTTPHGGNETARIVVYKGPNAYVSDALVHAFIVNGTYSCIVTTDPFVVMRFMDMSGPRHDIITVRIIGVIVMFLSAISSGAFVFACGLLYDVYTETCRPTRSYSRVEDTAVDL